MKKIKRFTAMFVLLCMILNLGMVFAREVTPLADFEAPKWALNSYLQNSVHNWFANGLLPRGETDPTKIRAESKIVTDPLNPGNQVLGLFKYNSAVATDVARLGHEAGLNADEKVFAASGKFYPEVFPEAYTYAFVTFLSLVTGGTEFIKIEADRILVRSDNKTTGTPGAVTVMGSADAGYERKWYDFAIIVDAINSKHTVYLDGNMYGPYDFLTSPSVNWANVKLQAGWQVAAMPGTVTTTPTARFYLDDIQMYTVDEESSLRLISKYPQDGGEYVHGKDKVEFTYSQALDTSVNPSVSVVKTGGGSVIPLSVTVSIDTVSITLPEDVDIEGEYTVTVSGVQSVLGNIADSASTTFTIVAEATPPNVDVTVLADFEPPTWPSGMYLSNPVGNTGWYSNGRQPTDIMQPAAAECKIVADPQDAGNQVLGLLRHDSIHPATLGHDLKLNADDKIFAVSGRIYPKTISPDWRFAYINFTNLFSTETGYIEVIRFEPERILVKSDNKAAGTNGSVIVKGGVGNPYDKRWYDLAVVIDTINSQHTVYLNNEKFGPYDFRAIPSLDLTKINLRAGWEYNAAIPTVGEVYLDDFKVFRQMGERFFKVSSKYPENGAVSVPKGETVEFNYNEELDPSANPTVTVTKTGAGSITPAAVSVKNKTVSVTLPYDVFGAEYTVTVSNVTSVFGYSAAQESTTFTTDGEGPPDLSPYTLDEIMLTTVEGEPLATIPASGKFIASVNAVNNNCVDEALLVVAAYGMRDILVSVNTVTNPLPAIGESGDYGVTLNAGQISKIKAFVWTSDWGVLMPLAQYIEYPN
ncbi:MAG: hypothetical protein M0R40_06575 [Firmicutes bacterium]|nr:hypothetical protein [Bacillota bacterium]